MRTASSKLTDIGPDTEKQKSVWFCIAMEVIMILRVGSLQPQIVS